MNPAARTVTVPLPGSHEHEVPSFTLSLESYVCQVAPRTCVKCPRASLSEGVTLRRLPVQQRWLEPLLASSLSTGTCSKTACVQPSMMECGLPVHQRYSMFAVCPQHCVTCSTDGGMSVVHTPPLVQKVTRPNNETGSSSLHAALHSSTYGDHHRPAPACHAP